MCIRTLSVILCCVVASDWIILLLFIYLILLIIVAVVKLLLPKSPPFVNQSVKKKEPKIVDFVDIEDLDKEKISYCRCWRSKKVCYLLRYSLLQACHTQGVQNASLVGIG